MAIRFFLGMFEAASMPGFALLSSQWYTVGEHNSRTGLWISSNGWGQIVGGLVAYGISRGTTDHPSALAGWKIIFIAIGCFTVQTIRKISPIGLSLIIFFYQPDTRWHLVLLGHP